MQRIAASLFLVLILGATAHAGLVVELSRNAILSGDFVRLQQVAHLEGDAATRRSAGRLFLGPVPDGGTVRRVTRDDIRRRLQEVGLGENLQFRGATTVLLQPATGKAKPTRVAAPVRQQADWNSLIQKAIIAHLAKSADKAESQVDIKVVGHYTKNIMPAPAVALVSIKNGSLPGRARVRLETRQEKGVPTQAFEAQVTVVRKQKALVLRRALKKGERILARDCKEEWVAEKLRVVYLASDVSLKNQAAAKSLRAGQPLVTGDLEEAIAIRKGAIIKVDTTMGGFRVQSMALALTDARLGESVRVQHYNPSNPKDKRTFAVRAVGPDKVEVLTPGR